MKMSGDSSSTRWRPCHVVHSSATWQNELNPNLLAGTVSGEFCRIGVRSEGRIGQSIFNIQYSIFNIEYSIGQSICMFETNKEPCGLSPLYSTQGQKWHFWTSVRRPYGLRTHVLGFQRTDNDDHTFHATSARMHRHLRQGCKLVRPHARLRMDDMCRPCGCSKQSSP